jgi:hypothetical protein
MRTRVVVGAHIDPIRLQHALAFGFDGIGPLRQPATFAIGLKDQGRGFGNVNSVGLAQALTPRGRVDRVAKDLEPVLSPLEGCIANIVSSAVGPSSGGRNGMTRTGSFRRAILRPQLRHCECQCEGPNRAFRDRDARSWRHCGRAFGTPGGIRW